MEGDSLSVIKKTNSSCVDRSALGRIFMTLELNNENLETVRLFMSPRGEHIGLFPSTRGMEKGRWSKSGK